MNDRKSDVLIWVENHDCIFTIQAPWRAFSNYYNSFIGGVMLFMLGIINQSFVQTASFLKF